MKTCKTIFICGTDTGVGKTLITGALCATLNAQGIRAGAFKPLESGCSPKTGMKRHLHRADAEFLKKMGGMPEPLDAINCYHFRQSLAPGIAARIEGQNISFKRIRNSLAKLQKKYDVIFVEGAGGLLVPITGLKTNLDLIKYLKTPVLLVARLGLGTLNHTLLTLAELKRHHVPTLGVILNEGIEKPTQAHRTNPAVLKKFGVKIRGIFPRAVHRSRKNLARLVEKSIKSIKIRDWTF